jgi:hypothetical protein
MLDHAHSLAPDAPVFALGVEIGDVTDVRLEGDHARVAFRVRSEHELTLHADACAMASRDAEHPALLVLPGETGELAGPIPECRLEESVMRELGATIGSALAEFSEGFFGEIGITPVLPTVPTAPGASPSGTNPSGTGPTVTGPNGLPQLPNGLGGSPGFGPAPACTGITARVTGTRPEAAVPLHLPEGGTRVEITFVNDGDRSFEVGPASQAIFMAEGRRAVEAATLPAQDLWFMPFSVPSHGSRAASVVFEGGDPGLVAIEIPGSHPTDEPLSVCTLAISF